MSEEYNYPKGGEQEYEGDGPNLRYDDFVGRIVQDPNEPPCLTLLSGYLGASSEEGHVRLYLDEELCRYVEIPEKAIRHTQELTAEQSPLGGSLVWIDRETEVLHGAAGSERRSATFLEGQIAQDYIGGSADYASTGITTQTRDCLAAGGGGAAGAGILPTDMGPGCGSTQYKFCPPPTQQVYCRTLTGILCTRFGPLCRRTVFEPACTFAGPLCGKSVYYPCFTISEPRCYISGPEDFTIYEQPGLAPQQFGQQQFGQEAAFAAGGAGAAGAAGFVSPSVLCPVTRSTSCPSRSLLGCFTRFANECQFDTAVRCVSRVYKCPTVSDPRCRISAVAFCPDTVAGCQADSAFCGVDLPGGGAVFERRINVGGVGADPNIGVFQTGFNCPSVFDNCATQEAFCPTQSPTCPSRLVVCQSQFNDCGVTRFNCPSVAIRCPTRDLRCISVNVRCPTQVEPRCFASRSFLCPDTRAGCQFDTAFCQVDPGQIGVDPAAGGGAQAFQPQAFQARANVAGSTQIGRECVTLTSGCHDVTVAHCPSRFVRCPSAVDLCPTRIGCPSRFTPCQSQLIRCQSQLDACPTRYRCPTLPPGCGGEPTGFTGQCETFGPCPSAVDACPSRFGCESQAGCFESQGCFPGGGGGGGFDPGGFGGGGGFGGF